MAGLTHRSFGSLRKLPSGRWQAAYTGPDGKRHSAPTTFRTKTEAGVWLDRMRLQIADDEWATPAAPSAVVATFGDYADSWLGSRPLKPRTRAEYRALLDQVLLPTFGKVPVKAITPAGVRAWHAGMGDRTPTRRSHAYGLLRTILQTALGDGLISANPCHIRGAGNVKRVSRTEPATLDELGTIAAAMPERYRALVEVTAWCALRFGEAAELRRSDVDLTAGVIRIRRGVVRAAGEVIVGSPKSDAGSRDVAIPPHIRPVLAEHLLRHAGPGPDGLVFPAADRRTQLAPSSLYRVFYPAREAAGRPDLRWHDLRHTGLTMAARTGATLAELMGRAGHSTPAAALRYQHAAAGRDQQIAAALSDLVGTV